MGKSWSHSQKLLRTRAVGYYSYDLLAGTLLIAGSFVGIKDPITFIDRKARRIHCLRQKLWPRKGYAEC